MSEPYSRRSFLAGVIACGTLTAWGSYLLSPSTDRRPPGPAPTTPGPARPVVLRIASGRDDSGARELLTRAWNQVNPDQSILIDPIDGASNDQREAMRTQAADGTVDIVNLDAVDVAEFAQQGWITRVTIEESGRFLAPPLRTCQVPRVGDGYWAVPFNTDVGLLFQRVPVGGPAEPVPPLSEVMARLAAGRGGRLVGQLRPPAGLDEAFVVNVLEHALAAEPAVLGEDGVPSFDLATWQRALRPLQQALNRVVAAPDEKQSADAFNAAGDIEFMRNWPTWYAEAEQARRQGEPTSQLRVGVLPNGILGGQNLAIVTRSRHRELAQRVIDFLTGLPAQKLLAAYGFAPTRREAYNDEQLRLSVPHLFTIREAIERARPRPVHPAYRAFAKLVRDSVYPVLWERAELPADFVAKMRELLR